jgi:hypothetical protein
MPRPRTAARTPGYPESRTLPALMTRLMTEDWDQMTRAASASPNHVKNLDRWIARAREANPALTDEQPDNLEAGGCRQLYELSVISQVSNVLRNHGALLIVGVIIVLVIVGVIFPAVWSGKRTRRTAALDVLDRILRWRRLLS